MHKPNAIRNPNGSWSLVGSGLPFELCYRNKDGSPATRQQIFVAKHCGPGFCRPKLVAVSFPTQAEALEALENSRQEANQ